MKSIKPRKQRKELFNAPLHKKRKWMASHLSENLLLKYDRRRIPVVKGDTVKVMRGSFRGHEDKVSRVNVKKRIVEIEGITMVKADGKKIAKPIHPSSLLITKLNLTDKWRRGTLERGLTEETKKEIETEAVKQIKEQEREEKLKAEEEKEQDIDEEELEEIPKEKQVDEKKPEPKKETKKEPVKTEKKPTPKKTTEKKTTPKKTPVAKKKSTAKKTTTKKPAKKKEEDKK